MYKCFDTSCRDEEIFRCGVRAAIVAFLLTDKESDLMDRVFDARTRETLAESIREVMNCFDDCRKEKITALRRLVESDRQYRTMLESLTRTAEFHVN